MSDANIRLKVSVQDDGSVVIKGIGSEFEGLGRKAKSGVGIASAAFTAFQGTVLVAVAAKFAQMATAAINYADSLDDVASKVGFTTTVLQEIRFAANEAGVGFEKTDKALQKFALNAGKAAQGEGELLEIAQKYNLVLTDSQGNLRSNIDIMGEVAEAVKGATTQQEKLRIAAAAFGAKEGAGLVSILNQGAAGFEEARKKAHEYGAVLEEDVIKKAQVTADKMDAAGIKIKKELSEAFVTVAPAIELAAAGLAKFVGFLADIVEKTPGVVSELVGNGGDYQKGYEDWVVKNWGYGPEQPAAPAPPPNLGLGEGTKKKNAAAAGSAVPSKFAVMGADATGPMSDYEAIERAYDAFMMRIWLAHAKAIREDGEKATALRREVELRQAEEITRVITEDYQRQMDEKQLRRERDLEDAAGIYAEDLRLYQESEEEKVRVATRAAKARETFEERIGRERWEKAAKETTEIRESWEAANKAMAFSSKNLSNIQLSAFQNVSAAAGREMTDMILHGEKWEDAMKNIWDSYISYVTQKLIEMAAWKSLMFFFPGGGGGGGIVGDIAAFWNNGRGSAMGGGGENFIRTLELANSRSSAPIVVHNYTLLDGEVVAKSVTRHAANGNATFGRNTLALVHR